MSITRQLHERPLALLTDLYQLTMAYAHWYRGDAEREAVFSLFFRKAPFDGGPAIACGLDAVLEFLSDFQFDEDDLAYLSAQDDAQGNKLFDDAFIDYLRHLRFTGDVHAMLEGTAAFPHEPLLRVRAPLLQAQFLETALLNLMNYPTLVATKAARMVRAAKDDPVADFGLRKAHGPGAGVLAARAAYIGGCAATSNVLAGRLFDIPITGTHAHGWVMAFDDELEAFQRYAEALPDNCIFLVDTYDTLSGVRHAIEVGHWLRRNGHEMTGIRLDSGNLHELSRRAREMLDNAGFDNAVIAASSSLDETAIAELKNAGAPICLWGVGTRLTTGWPDGSLEGVYKLTAIRGDDGNWQSRVKHSDTISKQSTPGIHQVRRYYHGEQPVADWLYDQGSIGADFESGRPVGQCRQVAAPANAEYEDLLVPVIQAGEVVSRPSSLESIRSYAISEYARYVAHGEATVVLEGRLDAERRRMQAETTPSNRETD